MLSKASAKEGGCFAIKTNRNKGWLVMTLLWGVNLKLCKLGVKPIEQLGYDLLYSLVRWLT